MLRKIKSNIAKDLFLCLSSSLLLILSFPKFNLWILAWIGFVPLFFAIIENKSKAKAFLLSYITGILFWSGTIYWLIHVTLPGTILLILYLGLYFGLFSLLVKSFELRAKSYELIFIPSIWVLLEYIRSHLFTGFPWALLGHSQHLNLAIIQIADITGVWGVSFLVMMVNLFIYRLIDRKSHKNYLLPLLLLLLSLAYGHSKLNRITYPVSGIPVRISVIQGNIPQELKWNPESNDFIIDKYFTLTTQAAKEKPDLIIWPEAAMPEVLEEKAIFYERVKKFIKEIRTPLLLGAVTSRDNFYYNSALLISSEAGLLNRYDKIHLVPFGEYIPLKKILPFLETVVPIGDITAGKEYTIFKILNPRLSNFAVLICFEDLFPELSRQFVKNGAEFLVNITNDAWYEHTNAASQHFQASVFRAVENRVFVIRSANTGVSGFIAPSGKIISLVKDKSGKDIFIDGFRTEEINILKETPSFYTRHGDIFIAACLLLLLLYAIITPFKNRR